MLKFRLLCTALMVILSAASAAAFGLSQYATQSKLATGKWVKISIPETGMYEITYDELRAMGFNNPSQVRLYGNGGYAINEKLDGSAIDDLQPVRVMRYGNKLCFYGKGSVQLSLTGNIASQRFTRKFNPYSSEGCYFLTEESTAETTVPTADPMSVTNYVNTPRSLSCFYHEKELVTVSRTGRDLLGEDFYNSSLKVDYFLPDIADSTIVVSPVFAVHTTELAYTNVAIHNGRYVDTVNFSLSTSRATAIIDEYLYYIYVSPSASLKLSSTQERGQFEPFMTLTNNLTNNKTKITTARLDYFILTYWRNNILRRDAYNQILMNYYSVNGNERFQLPNASSSTIVWNVTDESNPVSVPLTAYNDHSGAGYAFFSPVGSRRSFVAFDPALTLRKVTSFEPIANQNLHAMQTPELLIITDKAFHEQADRIADLHRAVDGIDVAVVDQDRIFNEFSSGTCDAMAYRLLCKMLYDRDPSKFKNLLLMGAGNMDNRDLMGPHDNYLLTYQSDVSNYENNSFTTDDFFGFLDDNSGLNLPSDKLRLGVGRITCIDVDEARNDVDKLVEYYANPDYGVWRNNTMVVSDSPNKGIFLYQGEAYKNQIDNDLNTGMHVNTVHNSQYPRSNEEADVKVEKRTATVAKQLMAENLKSGMYFATYVGHAGSIGFTKANDLWVSRDVINNSYRHMPIMSTACCNVAHFDCGSRGIAELMFHKRDGGAIALYTSCRMVLADGNDLANTYFIQGMFSNASSGVMPTLGEAYRFSKNSFQHANYNKLSLFLLGDPAIRINYPVSLFNITKVNGTSLTDSTSMARVTPLSKFAVDAEVVDASGNVDRTFNGDATVTLYDKQDLFATITQYGKERDVYFNRAKLAEISGRVVNGVFHGEMIAPKTTAACGETVLLRVYAHKDNTDHMVNGFTKQITMLPYDASQAINDQVSPVIEAMYLNDEATFTNGSVVMPGSLLYITASDNEAINVQTGTVLDCMKLALDGGKPSLTDVASYVTAAPDGKSINIEYPLSGLSAGLHSLTFTVYDLLGNSATRTITFMVGEGNNASMVADKIPAYVGGNVNFDLQDNGNTLSAPQYVVRVTDALGKLVWKTTTNTFPVRWNMKDMTGNQVPAGLYRFFGTYSDGKNCGGTPISNLIVLEPRK